MNPEPSPRIWRGRSGSWFRNSGGSCRRNCSGRLSSVRPRGASPTVRTLTTAGGARALGRPRGGGGRGRPPGGGRGGGVGLGGARRGGGLCPRTGGGDDEGWGGGGVGGRDPPCLVSNHAGSSW